jgi:hypothetical protein
VTSGNTGGRPFVHRDKDSWPIIWKLADRILHHQSTAHGESGVFPVCQARRHHPIINILTSIIALASCSSGPHSLCRAQPSPPPTTRFTSNSCSPHPIEYSRLSGSGIWGLLLKYNDVDHQGRRTHSSEGLTGFFNAPPLGSRGRVIILINIIE